MLLHSKREIASLPLSVCSLLSWNDRGSAFTFVHSSNEAVHPSWARFQRENILFFFAQEPERASAYWIHSLLWNIWILGRKINGKTIKHIRKSLFTHQTQQSFKDESATWIWSIKVSCLPPFLKDELESYWFGQSKGALSDIGFDRLVAIYWKILLHFSSIDEKQNVWEICFNESWQGIDPSLET